MQISSARSFSGRPSSDAVILPFWQKGKKAEIACSSSEFSSLFSIPVNESDFKGNEGEVLILYRKHPKEKRVLLLGLGEQESCSAEMFRKGYAAALKVCRQKKLAKLSVALPQVDFPAAFAIAEGLLLANYSFDRLRVETLKDSPALVQKICFIGIDSNDLKECLRAQAIVESVNFARDLVNGNADDVTPQMLSQTAKTLEKESKAIKTTVFGKKEIEKFGLGLLLAVNRASLRDPAFIIIEYRGNPRTSEVTALVGKGITYDTGGLNLKPGSSMESMKDDMSGAAAVLGTIRAAAKLRLRVNIVGAIVSTENAIGPASYKPGDVYRSYSGKTVEIGDTDAEGRLVLADAVSYVQDHYGPSRIIDLATLTGGILIALGDEASGLFCNNDRLAEDLFEAGNRTHERVWRFPLFPEYKEALKSSIADIKNIGTARKASSITGAMFIQEFIKGVPWAHLDIAGTAYLPTPRHYHPTNATGVGVRLLIEYLIRAEKI